MVSAVMLSALFVAQAAAPLCNDPNLLFLLDVSGTMSQVVEGKTKYTHAVSAIDAITTDRTDIRYGLSVFPKPYKAGTSQTGYCYMNSGMVVDFGAGSTAAIKAYLSPTGANYFGGPTGNNDTPIYQALEQANGYPAFNDETRRQAVVLITDGIQDCCRGRYLFPSASPPQDFNATSDCPNYPDTTLGEAEKANNRTAIIAMTAQLKARGLAVYIVGFGAQVDPLMLGGMAEAAGTKRTPTCNPTQANGNAADVCYYQASNATELTAALQNIAIEITTETCDNLDNDCNGTVDDGITRACQGCNGTGIEECHAGQWSGVCSVPTQAEICDGIDNDCDGNTDKTSCTTACGPGTKTCVNGAFGACTPLASIEELCNGRDDNCDGVTDEGCDCQVDEIRPCGSGHCAGQETCLHGKWQACVLASVEEEVCDGIDNDCDGKTDEGNNLCGPGKACIKGKCPDRTLDEPVNAADEQFLGSGIQRGCNGSGLTSPLGMIVVGLGLARAWRRRKGA